MRLPPFLLLLFIWLSAGGSARADVLRGSLGARAAENLLADLWALERYADAAAVTSARDRGDLVPVTSRGDVVLHEELGNRDRDRPELYRLARPWVLRFLRDLAADPSRPRGALPVTSLVRSEAYQRVLTRHYVNAARGTSAALRSSHLTGSTVDISTKKMPPRLRAWMRKKLADLERRGLVLATEERRASACFHVMVSPAYGHDAEIEGEKK